MAAAACVLLLIAFATVKAARAASSDVDLREDRDWLPHRFRTVATAAPGLARERGWVTHWLYADPGGDGVDDLFRANDHGICGAPWTAAGAGRDWQTNLPAAFARRGPCASIDGVWDIDGDGRAEVVATSGTPDGLRWWLGVMDAATGAPSWNVELAAGRDERGDGNWDGHYRALGPFTAHVLDGPRFALLVGVEAGHDERPRGVLALDAQDGHELWRYLIGPKPVAADFHIVDLDGDGRQEICLLGSGVSNLEAGEDVAGFGDDRARLFVLSDDGTLRWERALGEAPASGWLDAADLDGDGGSELVVTAFLPELGHEALAVLDGDGAILVSQELPRVCQSLAVAARAEGATAWLTFDGAARRYELSRSAIAPGAGAEYEGPMQVALVADVLGDAAPELVLGAGGRTWLTDASWRPLALLEDPDFLALQSAASLRRLPAGERRLVVLGDPLHQSGEFAVEANPRRTPWAWIVAGVATTGAAGAAWRWRRRRLAPEAARALRLQLLERLVGESHGQVGALSAAGRLGTFLISYAGRDGDRRQLEQRIRDLGRETLEAGVPQLAAAADVAALAGLDDETVRAARTALAELRETLTGIAAAWDGATPTIEAAAASAAALRPKVESARVRFHGLRKLVEKEFTASPTAVLARALTARADLISELGVDVVLPPEAVPDCFIDVEDLEFVLDNLIGNALRALEPVARRRLAVDWRPAGDLVALHIRDSGSGMTASEASAAFEPGETKRAGGGRGLPGSVERLRKYEGKLIVAATAPGEGTTMVLYLRHASRGAATAAPEVNA